MVSSLYCSAVLVRLIWYPQPDYTLSVRYNLKVPFLHKSGFLVGDRCEFRTDKSILRKTSTVRAGGFQLRFPDGKSENPNGSGGSGLLRPHRFRSTTYSMTSVSRNANYSKLSIGRYSRRLKKSGGLAEHDELRDCVKYTKDAAETDLGSFPLPSSC